MEVNCSSTKRTLSRYEDRDNLEISFTKSDLVDKLEIGKLAKSRLTDSTVRREKGAINHGPMTV